VTPGAQIVTASDEARSLPLVPYLGGSGIPFVPFAFKAPYALNLKVPAATTTTYVVGAPKLSLTYSGTGSSTHVYAQLVDNTTGLVLSNLATPIPVTLDGQSHTIDIPLEPVAYTMRPGASVTLQLVGSAGLYASVIPTSGVLDVTNMQLTLPTADPTSVTPTTVV
jgi:ABC-2 type transport system ATP-binding protein